MRHGKVIGFVMPILVGASLAVHADGTGGEGAALNAVPSPLNRRVHIESSNPKLELRRAGTDELICLTPCDRSVEFHPSEQFYFGGEGVTRSGPFTIAPRNAALSFHVTTGNSSAHAVGVAFLVVGTAGLAVGTPLALNGFFEGFSRLGSPWVFCSTTKCEQEARQHLQDQQDRQTGGLVLVSVGLVAGLIGLLTTLNNRTDWSADTSVPADGGAGGPKVSLVVDPRRGLVGLGGTF